MTTRPRALPLLLILALLVAVAVAGCGGSSSGPLGDALSFVPKNTPVVIQVKTDTSDQQYKQLNQLLSRFPGGSQIAQGILSSISRNGLNFNNDIKPVLGNDLILAVPRPQDLRTSGSTPFLLALKVKDTAKATSLIQRDATKSGTVQGTDVYHGSSGSQVFALKDGVLIEAPTQAELGDAIARHGGSDHLATSDLDSWFAGLPSDALVRIGGNIQTILSQSSNGGLARQVKWVGALTTFGTTVSADTDGLSVAFAVRTGGGLSNQDLPIAAGPQSPAVIRRAGEIGIGVRGADQIVRFAEGAAQTLSPGSYGQFTAAKAQLGSQLGIDIDRDLIGAFAGDTAISVALDGNFGLRATLADPQAFKATLAKVAGQLPKLGKSFGLKSPVVVKPAKGNPFYALATANGKHYVFGVVGSGFVLATDPARAAQFATAAATPVPRAQGAITIESDARALAASIGAKSGQGAAIAAFTGPLGDLVGSIKSGTNGLSGSFKLNIH